MENKPKVYRVTIANISTHELISWCLNRCYSATVTRSVGTWWDETTGNGGLETGATLEMVISQKHLSAFVETIRELLTDRQEICAYITIDGSDAITVHSYDYAGDPVQTVKGE